MMLGPDWAVWSAAAPTMDATALKDLKVKVGETIKFEVPISGEPTPEAIWTANDKRLKDGVHRCKVHRPHHPPSLGWTLKGEARQEGSCRSTRSGSGR